MIFYVQAAEKHVTAEETVQQLEIQVQDLQAELNRVRELLSSCHFVVRKQSTRIALCRSSLFLDLAI